MQLNADQLKAYEAQTARLEKLAQFLIPFAPAYGEKAGDSYVPLADDHTPAPILKGRDEAVRAAFEAVRRIATNS